MCTSQHSVPWSIQKKMWECKARAFWELGKGGVGLSALFFCNFLGMSMASVENIYDSYQAQKKLKVEKMDNISPHSLLVKKLSPNATVPTRGSSMAAGYDLYR